MLILHGRHPTCHQGTTVEPITVWPCPSGWDPLPSYRGYQRIQQLFASQGYVTVSISANGINAQDGAGTPPQDAGAQARSSAGPVAPGPLGGLGRQRYPPSAPDIVRTAPVPDMSNVLLSATPGAAKGVSRAAVDSLTRPPAAEDGAPGPVDWTIRGLALIAPTLFSHNPAPDVPSMVILPSCDGDVSNLEGQQYLDAARGVGQGHALHSSVFVVGANHNYFNTEWTPGLSVAKSWDDYPSPYDPTCRWISPLRLTPDQQQDVGATYVAAAAAVFITGDDQVRPLLDGWDSGRHRWIRSPCTATPWAATARVSSRSTPARWSVAPAGGFASRSPRPPRRRPPATPPCRRTSSSSDRSGLRSAWYAVQVDWVAPGTPVSIQPPAPVSLATAQSLAIRIVVASGVASPEFHVAITDTSGRRATLGTATLDPMPPATQTYKDWAQEVRMPLGPASAAGLDLTQVASLEVVPSSEEAWARIWLLDAWGWSPGLPAPQTSSLPRVDLGEQTVPEGDSGTITYHVPAQVSGSGNGQVRVFVRDPVTNTISASVATVSPGSTSIAIPIAVTGNTQPGDGRTYLVAVKAINGVSVGDAYGQLVVTDDD